MIRIAVCDDDKNITEYIYQYLLRKNEQLKEEQLDISLYHSGTDFLRDVEDGATFHIVFMDIQMDGLNGIEAGQALRSRSDIDDVILIYISNHDTYSHALLEVGSYRFIRKPVGEKKLDEVASRAITQALMHQEQEKNPSLFHFNIHKDIHFVRTQEIVYLKSTNKSIDIYVWQPKQVSIVFLERFYSSIPKVLAQLSDNNLTQCERSYIVNLRYVKRMTGSNFILADKNETPIPIGRAHKDQVKIAYTKRRGIQYG